LFTATTVICQQRYELAGRRTASMLVEVEEPPPLTSDAVHDAIGTTTAQDAVALYPNVRAAVTVAFPCPEVQ